MERWIAFKILICVLIIIAVFWASDYAQEVWLPDQKGDLHMRQMENSDQVAHDLRQFQTMKNWIEPGTWILAGLVPIVLFWGDFFRFIDKKGVKA